MISLNVAYLYVQPYLYKYISKEETCRTHYSYTINLFNKSPLNDLERFLMFIPVVHIYFFYKLNKWLSHSIYNDNRYSLKMTLLGQIYYIIIAWKITKSKQTP